MRFSASGFFPTVFFYSLHKFLPDIHNIFKLEHLSPICNLHGMKDVISGCMHLLRHRYFQGTVYESKCITRPFFDRCINAINVTSFQYFDASLCRFFACCKFTEMKYGHQLALLILLMLFG
jgi:hypothetical protein